MKTPLSLEVRIYDLADSKTGALRFQLLSHINKILKRLYK